MYRILSQMILLRSLFRALLGGLLGLAGLASFTLCTLVLHVLVVNTKGLIDLSAKCLLVVKTRVILVTNLIKDNSGRKCDLQAKKFSVVHLQKHTSDLAGELGLLSLDLGVQSLTKHLLLLRGRSSAKSLSVQAATNASLRLRDRLGGSVLSTTAATAHLTLKRHATTALTETTAHTLAHGHTRDLATTTAATSTKALHLSHRLRVGHAVRKATRTLDSAHGNTLSEVGGNLLVGTHATAALLRERRELARTSTGDTGHHHTRLRGESQTTTLAGGDETLLTRAVEDSGLHVLGIVSFLQKRAPIQKEKEGKGNNK